MTTTTDRSAGDARGDTAIEQVVQLHRRELLVHCYRMLGGLKDAEDAVQETLLKAWRRLDTFEGRSSVRAWTPLTDPPCSTSNLGSPRWDPAAR